MLKQPALLAEFVNARTGDALVTTDKPAKQKLGSCKHLKRFATSYCNHTHCLSCGQPIAHECVRLSPAVLKLEYDSVEEWLIPSVQEVMKLAEPRYGKMDEHRRELRQWFCPPEIARLMAGMAELYCRSENRWSPDVLEPCAGAGILLTSMFSPSRGRMIGLDVCPQPNWADLTRYGLEFYDASTWGTKRLGSLEFNQDVAHQVGIPQDYDVILMHPPFGGQAGSSDKGTPAMRNIILWARTQKYFKGWDFDAYAVFMRHFILALRPGGVMVTLTPGGWTFNSRAEKMRRTLLEEDEDIWLIAQADLRGVQLWKDAIVDCVVSVIRRGKRPLNDQIVFYDLRGKKLADVGRTVLACPADYYPFFESLRVSSQSFILPKEVTSP